MKKLTVSIMFGERNTFEEVDFSIFSTRELMEKYNMNIPSNEFTLTVNSIQYDLDDKLPPEASYIMFKKKIKGNSEDDNFVIFATPSEKEVKISMVKYHDIIFSNDKILFLLDDDKFITACRDEMIAGEKYNIVLKSDIDEFDNITINYAVPKIHTYITVEESWTLEQIALDAFIKSGDIIPDIEPEISLISNDEISLEEKVNTMYEIALAIKEKYLK